MTHEFPVFSKILVQTQSSCFPRIPNCKWLFQYYQADILFVHCC